MLVNYSESFGRMGGLEDLFVVTRAELAAIRAIKRFPRGEVLGKHSDITSTCDDSTLHVVCDDQDWIARGIEYKVLCGPGFVADLVADWHDIGDGEARLERMRAALSAEDFRTVCELWGLPCA